MYEVYNPYKIDYGNTIVQSFAFYDANSRMMKQYGEGDNLYSKKITPDQYFMEWGFQQLRLSLSTNEEMDYRPLKDNCIIDLSLEEKSNMNQVEIDYYYEQEKDRCFDHFKYAQNKTFQFVSFLRVAYDKFSTLFGTQYNYLVRFNDKWVNIATGLIYENILNDNKSLIYLSIYHARQIDDYRGTITDTYYVDMSNFFETIGYYKISDANYSHLHNEQIDSKFNLKPKNININPETSQPYNIVTDLQQLTYIQLHTSFDIYSDLIHYIQESYVDSYNSEGERSIEIIDKSVLKTYKRFSIEPQYPHYVFYSDCGLVMYVIEPISFDLKTEKTIEDFRAFDYIKTTYSYEIDNIYFRLKFFALPEFEGFVNAPSSATGDFGFLQDFKEELKKKKCCLLNCMKKQK